MVLDSVLGDPQFRGDDLICLPLRNRTEHIEFSLRQRVIGRMLCHLPSNLWRYPPPSRVNYPNRIDQLCPQQILEQIPDSACLKRPERYDVSGCGGKDYKARIGELLSQDFDRFNSPQSWHTHIHERDIWKMSPKQFNRFVAIRCFGHHLHIRLGVNFAAQPRTHNWMIVD